MFTLQSNLIANAANSGSAKDMVQAVGNCAAPLEHRGPIANTYVNVNEKVNFSPIFSEGPSFFGGPTINIPPWQNIPFVPAPYIDTPPFFPFVYAPRWHGGEPNPFPQSQPAVTVLGPTRLGDVVSNSHTTVNMRIDGNVFHRGQPLTPVRETLVTNVFWDGAANALKVTKRDCLVMARLRKAVTTEVIDAEECP